MSRLNLFLKNNIRSHLKIAKSYVNKPDLKQSNNIMIIKTIHLKKNMYRQDSVIILKISSDLLLCLRNKILVTLNYNEY